MTSTRRRPARRAHVDKPVVDQKILALYEFHPHLAGKKHVLVESRVVDPGGQKDDAGIDNAGRRKFSEGLTEQQAVMLDAANVMLSKQVAKAGLYRAPVGQHIGDAGRHPQIVLQNQESVVGSYDVGTANGDVGAVFVPPPRAFPHGIVSNHARGRPG